MRYKSLASIRIKVILDKSEFSNVEIVRRIRENSTPVLRNVCNIDLKRLEEMFLRTYKIKEYRQVISYRNLDIMQLAMIKNMERKISLEKQDLDSILKELNIEVPERHRALVDCYLEFKAMCKLLNM